MTARLTGFIHDGLTFDVTDHGPADGPVVIALHGFPQTGSSWAGVLPRLTAAGYRVLVPDQRGYSPGARPPQVAAYRIDRLAGDVLALADAAGTDRFHVLGHDWGGGVAWYLAARHPDRVITLSVVSTPHPRAMIAAMPRGQFLRSWYMLAFQVPVLPERLFAARGGALVRRMAGDGPGSEDLVRLLGHPESARSTLNWYRAMRVPGAPSPGRVTVPTLYVWPSADRYLGREAALGTAAWVTGPYRFVELPGVSHWVPEEVPDRLAGLVLDHLAGHPDPEPPRPPGTDGQPTG